MAVNERINQGTVIASLNKYLDFHSLPLRMNKKGVCRGLACVHAKYVLEGKEEEYFSILKKIAAMKQGAKYDNEIERFVLEVILSFMPNVFDTTKGQRHSLEALQINGKKLEPAFSFGMIGRDYKWELILKKINLQTDEVMLVELIGHAVNVRSLGEGKFRIYDPNYSMGYEDVNEITGVVSELRNIAKKIGIDAKNLGMGIQIVRHPDAKPRAIEFPKPAELYKRHLVPGARHSTGGGKFVDNLFFAILHDDLDAFDCILKKAREKGIPITENLTKSACTAVTANSVKILNAILALPESKQIDANALIYLALMNGRKEVFDLVINGKCNKFFYNQKLNIKFAAESINAAASGGNVELLKEVIERYKKSGFVEVAKRGNQVAVKRGLTDQQIAKEIMKETPPNGDAIESAIKEGSARCKNNTECVQCLFDQLQKASYKVDDMRMLEYLLLAIKINEHPIVDCLIKNIQKMPAESQKRIFESIEVNVTAVEKTELSILRSLKDCGVHFERTAEAAMLNRENEPVSPFTSFIRAIAIAISKWIDSDTAKFVNIGKFKSLKSTMQEMKAAAVPTADAAETRVVGKGMKGELQNLKAEAAARAKVAAPSAASDEVPSSSPI